MIFSFTEKIRQKVRSDMYQYFNPNLVTDRAGDCSVRAIAKALGISWEEAYMKLTANGFLMGDIMSSDLVWGSVLRQNGFSREIIPNSCPECYTVADFCEDHPSGIYVVKSDGHVATVIDGILYDSWDSSLNIPIYVWKKGE